jgi:hypothetical protein
MNPENFTAIFYRKLCRIAAKFAIQFTVKLLLLERRRIPFRALPLRGRPVCN